MMQAWRMSLTLGKEIQLIKETDYFSKFILFVLFYFIPYLSTFFHLDFKHF